MGACCSECLAGLSTSVDEQPSRSGPRIVTLRPKADSSRCLCVTRSGLGDGGWLHMWRQVVPDKYGQWHLHQGVLRSQADPTYVLCLMQSGVRDGGGLHMWQKADDEEVSDPFARWQIEGGVVRASVEPKFYLCVKRSGLCDGGHLHVWSFGDEGPDEFGQWQIEDVDVCGPYASLGPSACLLKSALAWPASGRPAEAGGAAEPLHRTDLLEGLDAFAVALEALASGTGRPLQDNVGKMRRSKATEPDAGDYRAWLLSEAPVHASWGHRGYVDDSAWMANLWTGWILEFFVELLALVHAGGEVAGSCQSAYGSTLRAHHNALQRVAFGQALKKLPARPRLMASLGGADNIGAFVETGRRVYRCCLALDEELAALQTTSRK